MRSLAQLESSTLEQGDSGRRYLDHRIRLRSNFISLQSPLPRGGGGGPIHLLPGNIIRWLIEGFSREARCLRANSAGLFAGVMTGRSVNGICGRGS